MKTIFKINTYFLLLIAVCSLSIFINCSSAAKTAANSNSSEIKPVSSETPSEMGAATSDKAIDNKVGVPECDTYIEKYEACITSKIPESAHEAIKNSFEETRKNWKNLATNPQSKASLASACKQAHETAKQTMAAYQCDW